MIKQLIREKMRIEKLSLRSAAGQIGIAHTTLARIIDGEKYDLDTLTKISKWLDTKVSNLLDLETDPTAQEIAAFLKLYPALGDIFYTAIKQIGNDKLSPDVLQDLLQYATFRINQEQGGTNFRAILNTEEL